MSIPKHKISLSLHGCKAGTPPMLNDHKRGVRGTVGGWSASTSRRNIDFLRSVEPDSLSGVGIAFTGTIKTCPETSDDWKSIREAFHARLRRMGLIRSHWVTEWQRRGVPHLHCALWFPDGISSVEARLAITRHWLEVTADFGSKTNGQYALMINDAIGWFQYVAKHAARGASHYQRSPENIPPEWQRKTGRMWGKIGDWVTRDSVDLFVPPDVFHTFRRMCRNWRLADARASNDRYRILSARKMLQSHLRTLSTVRGLSEWLPIESSSIILHWACQQSKNPEIISHY